MNFEEIKEEIDKFISIQYSLDFDKKNIYKKYINELREFLDKLEKDFDKADK